MAPAVRSPYPAEAVTNGKSGDAADPLPLPDNAEEAAAIAKSHRRRRRSRWGALNSVMEHKALVWRRTTLDPQGMLSSAPADLIDAVAAYCAQAFGPGSAEIADCVRSACSLCPEGLRVKELLESFETYREIAAFAHDASKAKQVDCIYDLACGHGMVGVLLAYRFPRMRVVCVDLARRPLFDAFAGSFRKHGHPLAGESEALSNLSFQEGDISSVELTGTCLAVAVHACNELNRIVIEAAQGAGACWAVLPCCVREGTYLHGSLGGNFLRENSSEADEAKHLLICGVVAGLYKAERLQTIDRRITNRNILLCGGAGFTSYEDAKRCASEGRAKAEEAGEACAKNV
eukprot:TRINITY_DN23274_c0_g1_i3.p1 TRINITY_DN23274_c0_g1~~TRINITY_DN23274_c0_g1_i3.p1  ORF type:complete len:346 (+),score=71.55 TRINITY_DN23274_c0_g1_i3:54-1091(+)